MNERIRELADEAEKYALDNVGKGHYGIEDLIYQFQFVDTMMAKFAELIVRECAQVCLAQRDPANLNYKPSEKFAEAVKQHFGVEE
jgi:hypothetical protein